MKIVDFIIRVKNGYLAKKESIDVPFTNLVGSVAEILQKEGFITSFSKIEKDGHPHLTLILKYEGLEPAFTDVKLVSKPGRRIYKGVSELRPVIGGMGIAVLTSSRGVMTDKQARKLRVGGEVLFEIW